MLPHEQHVAIQNDIWQHGRLPIAEPAKVPAQRWPAYPCCLIGPVQAALRCAALRCTLDATSVLQMVTVDSGELVLLPLRFQVCFDNFDVPVRRNWAHPSGSALPHLHWGSPLPHLRRDRTHPCHICAGTGLGRDACAPRDAHPPVGPGGHGRLGQAAAAHAGWDVLRRCSRQRKRPEAQPLFAPSCCAAHVDGDDNARGCRVAKSVHRGAQRRSIILFVVGLWGSAFRGLLVGVGASVSSRRLVLSVSSSL